MIQWRENRRIDAAERDRNGVLPGRGGRQILPPCGESEGSAGWR